MKDLLFELLEYPPIAADWCEDHGRQIAAAWLREEGILPPRLVQRDESPGAGNGDGSGRASGTAPLDGNTSVDDTRGCLDGKADGFGSGTGFGTIFGAVSLHRFNLPESDITKSVFDDGYWDQFAREEHMPQKGDYVIVRGRESGCTAGVYQRHSGREVVLTHARAIWSWSAEPFRLCIVDVAQLVGSLRVSLDTGEREMIILDACAIIPTTDEAAEYIRSLPGNC